MSPINGYYCDVIVKSTNIAYGYIIANDYFHDMLTMHGIGYHR